MGASHSRSIGPSCWLAMAGALLNRRGESASLFRITAGGMKASAALLLQCLCNSCSELFTFSAPRRWATAFASAQRLRALNVNKSRRLNPRRLLQPKPLDAQFAQAELLHLAGDRRGILVHEYNVARHLEM